MPITRRRRANPPDQPENNNNHSAETTTNTGETSVSAHPETPTEETTHTQLEPVAPPVEQSISQPSSPGEMQAQPSVQSPSTSVISSTNGERPERQGPERHGGEKPEHSTPIESGRRTPRGELFRRPPQVPPQTPVHAPVTSAPPLQPPSHEISLPLGNLLHLSYNPGYTGAEEARSQLLQHLAQESKNGGRARCWNCGSLAIMYDRWNTRSKTFGEVGVAICEICGVWSVM
ncbi:MAG: hypothetical protein NVS4B7_11100 [Ktedonobacteraceae bacterium]